MAAKKKTAAQVAAEEREALAARIRDSLDGWYAGRWAEEINYGPACSCTLAAAKEPCILHGASDDDTAAAG